MNSKISKDITFAKRQKTYTFLEKYFIANGDEQQC